MYRIVTQYLERLAILVLEAILVYMWSHGNIIDVKLLRDMKHLDIIVCSLEYCNFTVFVP